jgi:hypothetical protein
VGLMKTLALFAALALSACGGQVVFEEKGSSDGGGGSTGTAPPPPSQNTTGPTPPGCATHSDCGEGRLCVFSSNTCADACEIGSCDSCGVGMVCNDCATSACPDCLDCRGACVPKNDNQCDDDDPCGVDLVCLFDSGYCTPACNAEGFCFQAGQDCTPCATGSCCGCDDCVSACIGIR